MLESVLFFAGMLTWACIHHFLHPLLSPYIERLRRRIGIR